MEKRTPRDSFLRKKKNASGGVEAKFISCKECGIDFCTGKSCKIFDYDSFKRIAVSTVQTTGEQTQEQTSQEKKTSKKRNTNKGSKIKSRANNTSVTIINKNTPAKNGDKNIISVKTDKKKNSLTIPEKATVKSKVNVKNFLSRGNIEIQKNEK